MGFNGQTTEYISSGKYASVAAWAATHSYAAGAFVRQLATPSLYNERVFVALTAGTSGGTEPTWTFNRGDKITDSGVTWQECTGLPAVNGDFTNSPNWSTGGNGSISQGHVIVDNARTHAFICSTSGSSSGTEPTWNVSAIGNTTTDGSNVWTYLGSLTSGNIVPWGSPHCRLHQASQWTNTAGASGIVNKIFFGNTHNETQSTDSINVSFGTDDSNGGMCSLICIDETASLPPTSAALTTGAVCATSSNQQILLGGHIYVYGIEFKLTGSGTTMSMSNDGQHAKEYDNCKYTFGSTGNFNLFLGGDYRVTHRNCTITLGSGTGNQFISCGGDVEFYGGSIVGSAISSGQTLIQNGNKGQMLFRGTDMSAVLTSSGNPYIFACGGNQWKQQVRLEECIFGAGYIPAAHLYSENSPDTRLIISRCRFANEFQVLSQCGNIFNDNTAYRTGGASDGTNPFGWHAITDATYTDPFLMFLDSPPIVAYNSSTGVSLTLTAHGVWGGSSAPTNADVWLEADYQGTSGSPLGVHVTNKWPNVLAAKTSLTLETTSAWDGGLTARVNSHAYNVGDMFKVASNPGRVFFCTSGGTSAGSEPGGFATAIDGGSVTDSGATFRAGWRFSMSVSLASVQNAGNYTAQVRFGTPGSIPTLIDPLLLAA